MEVAFMEVEDSFTLERADLRLVLLKPHFPIPKDWPHGNSHSETVRVMRPDGSEMQAVAAFHFSHFNLRGPEVDLRKSWRLTVSIHGYTKEDVPPGSKLLASRQTAKVILDAVALELGD